MTANRSALMRGREFERSVVCDIEADGEREEDGGDGGGPCLDTGARRDHFTRLCEGGGESILMRSGNPYPVLR